MTDWPSRLSVPPLTASPICFTTGMDSPVNADSSADVAPSIITPSTGKSSPGLTSNSSADLHFLNRDFYPATVFTSQCVFRRDFEQRLDRFACAIICELLQPLLNENRKSSVAPSVHPLTKSAPSATATIRN